MVDIFSIKPSVISKDLKGKYILLYGAPKVGKTSFAVQAPRCFVCQFENGTNALSGVIGAPIMKWADMKSIVSQLRKPQGRENFDTVAIDTVTIAWNLCEKYICQREGVESVRDIPWGQGFNMVKQEFQETWRELSLLGYGLIFTAHEKTRATDMVDAEGNPIQAVCPDIPNACYNIVNGICDIIGYIQVVPHEDGTGERWFYTRPTPTIFAGSRYANIAPKIPFGYTELVNAIGDAIDSSIKNDGAIAVDHIDTAQITSRPFADVMNDTKNAWMAYINKADNDEDRDYRLTVLNEIVKHNFGKIIKLPSVTPSQQDMLELVLEEIKAL